MCEETTEPIPLPPPAGQHPAPAPSASVWVTGQQDAASQLAHRGYLPATAADHGRIPPAIAAHAITAYTRAGALVLDPDCGAGTVLVEALHTGRHAVGITPDRRRKMLARANVTAAQQAGAWPHATVLDGRPGHLSPVHLAGLAGRVDLVLTTLRHPHPTRPRAARHPQHPAPEPGSLGRLHQALRRARPLLQPGSHVIITLRPHRHHGLLRDLPGRVTATATDLGLIPVQRCVALLARLSQDRIITRATLAQRRCAARHQHNLGHPIGLLAHHDVLIFTVPEDWAAGDAQPADPAGDPGHEHQLPPGDPATWCSRAA
ncbi:MAG TPA: DNA methyltransferase [Pseudonocardiaceae bacterium]|jgi:hypothetical protein|nr:DNA methyltransferase [Pseudonocardiaceae bacterium]